MYVCSVVMLSVFMLSVVMLSVIMLSVVMLSIMGPMFTLGVTDKLSLYKHWYNVYIFSLAEQDNWNKNRIIIFLV
jgi:hypothetical protein